VPKRGLVHDAMARLGAKVASYRAANASDAAYASGRRAACGFAPEGLTRAIGSRPFMRTFYETHAKLRTCLAHVRNFERARSMRFDWIVRLRPDAWFFGPLPAYCSLDAARVSFPVGVTGCGYAPCINDHIAFAPRHLAAPYFDVVTDMASCEGIANLSTHWRNYVLWRLMGSGVPLAEPSPIVPYTLLRPCANASLASFYPECTRWTSRSPEKNAGLTHYVNGSLLPGANAFRLERARRYERCRTLAALHFPAYRAIEASGAERSLCAARHVG